MRILVASIHHAVGDRIPVNGFIWSERASRWNLTLDNIFKPTRQATFTEGPTLPAHYDRYYGYSGYDE